jgi:hypothetical protein
MTPEERKDLIDAITAKMQDMDDDELARIAVDHDIPVKSAMDKRVENGDSPLSTPPVVDTSVLTGPITSLKNFLVKKQSQNDAK